MYLCVTSYTIDSATAVSWFDCVVIIVIVEIYFDLKYKKIYWKKKQKKNKKTVRDYPTCP